MSGVFDTGIFDQNIFDNTIGPAGTFDAGIFDVGIFDHANVYGTANLTQAGQTVSSAGGVAVRGSVAVTQGANTVLADGTVITISRGVLDITQASQTASAGGSVAISGIAAITAGGDTSTGGGKVRGWSPSQTSEAAVWLPIGATASTWTPIVPT